MMSTIIKSVFLLWSHKTQQSFFSVDGIDAYLQCITMMRNFDG